MPRSRQPTMPSRFRSPTSGGGGCVVGGSVVGGGCVVGGSVVGGGGCVVGGAGRVVVVVRRFVVVVVVLECRRRGRVVVGVRPCGVAPPEVVEVPRDASAR